MSSRILSSLQARYESLKVTVSNDAKSPQAAKFLIELTDMSLKFLEKTSVRVPLISLVPNKSYFSFSLKSGKQKTARAINEALFDFKVRDRLNHILNNSLVTLPQEERKKLLYTTAMAFCCAIDLLKKGDQKTPATYFECLIEHLLSRTFGINPRSEVEVLRLEEEASTLPTDLIFDLGPGKSKFHVPIKISTRERVIQVFAHQKVLDGVHGIGTFTGMLVCLTETKLDHTKNEVVEICLPKQWILYQRFIAPIHRFYYFDLPKKYALLKTSTPPMQVLSFSEFFDEAQSLTVPK